MSESPSKKSICFFFGDFAGSGGAERASITIANGLAQRGHAIFLLSLSGGDDPFFPLHPSIKSFKLFNSKTKLIFQYFNVARKIRQFAQANNIDIWVDVDVILSTFSSLAFVGWKGKHISWEHFNFRSPLGRFQRRIARYLAARRADEIVTLTESDKEMWKAALRPRAVMTVIANPLPFPRPAPVPFEDRTKTVLAVGRLTAVKGFDLLLHAWAKVKLVSEDFSQWSLQIVGGGPESESLKALATDLAISNTVVFIGQTSDVHAYYRRASVYCLSSRAEGLPMVLIEAQAYGLPIVSFDCLTGPAEIVAHGENGLLASAEDVSQLSTALCTLMRDEQQRKDFSTNAWQQASRFNQDGIVTKWEQIFSREVV